MHYFLSYVYVLRPGWGGNAGDSFNHRVIKDKHPFEWLKEANQKAHEGMQYVLISWQKMTPEDVEAYNKSLLS